MGRVAKKRAFRNRQSQARRMNRINQQKKKSRRRRIKLTEEQKYIRSEKIKRREEEKQKRKQIVADKEESSKIKNLREALSSVFDSDSLDLLARATGFIKRAGNISAFSFVYIVSFGFLGNGNLALTYLVAGLSKNFGIIVTPQALSKRINSQRSVDFIKEILRKLIEAQLSVCLKNRFSETFSMFDGIFLEDSSTISLNERLSEYFKGSGGGASKSALKIDFIFEVMNSLVYGAKILNGTVPDQASTRDILKLVKAKSLCIRDLGYFCIDALRKIEALKAYYLSRLSVSTYIYLNKDDVEPLDVPKYLKSHLHGSAPISLEIYIGKEERFKSRLVAEKVPENVSKHRTDKFKKEKKKNPSTYYKEWLGFSIFVTNIPSAMFCAKMVIVLYKIRWQVELVFKNFKSNIEIDIIKGSNRHRIEGLIYGRLITIITIFSIQNYASNIVEEQEVSGDKLTKWLECDNRLQVAIREEGLINLLILLELDRHLICKQKRKRKTTYDMLEELLKMEMKLYSTSREKKALLYT
jgi:hypothetical protein